MRRNTSVDSLAVARGLREDELRDQVAKLKCDLLESESRRSATQTELQKARNVRNVARALLKSCGMRLTKQQKQDPTQFKYFVDQSTAFVRFVERVFEDTTKSSYTEHIKMNRAILDSFTELRESVATMSTIASQIPTNKPSNDTLQSGSFQEENTMLRVENELLRQQLATFEAVNTAPNEPTWQYALSSQITQLKARLSQANQSNEQLKQMFRKVHLIHHSQTPTTVGADITETVSHSNTSETIPHRPLTETENIYHVPLTEEMTEIGSMQEIHHTRSQTEPIAPKMSVQSPRARRTQHTLSRQNINVNSSTDIPSKRSISRGISRNRVRSPYSRAMSPRGQEKVSLRLPSEMATQMRRLSHSQSLRTTSSLQRIAQIYQVTPTTASTKTPTSPRMASYSDLPKQTSMKRQSESINGTDSYEMFPPVHRYNNASTLPSSSSTKQNNGQRLGNTMDLNEPYHSTSTILNQSSGNQSPRVHSPSKHHSNSSLVVKQLRQQNSALVNEIIHLCFSLGQSQTQFQDNDSQQTSTDDNELKTTTKQSKRNIKLSNDITITQETAKNWANTLQKRLNDLECAMAESAQMTVMQLSMASDAVQLVSSRCRRLAGRVSHDVDEFEQENASLKKRMVKLERLVDSKRSLVRRMNKQLTIKQEQTEKLLQSHANASGIAFGRSALQFADTVTAHVSTDNSRKNVSTKVKRSNKLKQNKTNKKKSTKQGKLSTNSSTTKIHRYATHPTKTTNGSAEEHKEMEHVSTEETLDATNANENDSNTINTESNVSMHTSKQQSPLAQLRAYGAYGDGYFAGRAHQVHDSVSATTHEQDNLNETSSSSSSSSEDEEEKQSDASETSRHDQSNQSPTKPYFTVNNTSEHMETKDEEEEKEEDVSIIHHHEIESKDEEEDENQNENQDEKDEHVDTTQKQEDEQKQQQQQASDTHASSQETNDTQRQESEDNQVIDSISDHVHSTNHTAATYNNSASSLLDTQGTNNTDTVSGSQEPITKTVPVSNASETDEILKEDYHSDTSSSDSASSASASDKHSEKFSDKGSNRSSSRSSENSEHSAHSESSHDMDTKAEASTSAVEKPQSFVLTPTTTIQQTLLSDASSSVISSKEQSTSEIKATDVTTIVSETSNGMSPNTNEHKHSNTIPEQSTDKLLTSQSMDVVQQTNSSSVNIDQNGVTIPKDHADTISVSSSRTSKSSHSKDDSSDAYSTDNESDTSSDDTKSVAASVEQNVAETSNQIENTETSGVISNVPSANLDSSNLVEAPTQNITTIPSHTTPTKQESDSDSVDSSSSEASSNLTNEESDDSLDENRTSSDGPNAVSEIQETSDTNVTTNVDRESTIDATGATETTTDTKEATIDATETTTDTKQSTIDATETTTDTNKEAIINSTGATNTTTDTNKEATINATGATNTATDINKKSSIDATETTTDTNKEATINSTGATNTTTDTNKEATINATRATNTATDINKESSIDATETTTDTNKEATINATGATNTATDINKKSSIDATKTTTTTANINESTSSDTEKVQNTEQNDNVQSPVLDNKPKQNVETAAKPRISETSESSSVIDKDNERSSSPRLSQLSEQSLAQAKGSIDESVPSFDQEDESDLTKAKKKQAEMQAYITKIRARGQQIMPILKKWEQEFQQEHGKPPSTNDKLSGPKGEQYKMFRKLATAMNEANSKLKQAKAEVAKLSEQE